MVQVAHHGGAATQLCGASIVVVVIAQGPIIHHGRDVGEHTLQWEERRPEQSLALHC